ncbi:hypothetical protein OG241_23255 [Streptomyces sp. NBC_01390]|uniref:hypothetical protein n=1 Tax=Streptomyces sp. NBC_01390 TaxID=2903850 RepID=UPI003251A65F
MVIVPGTPAESMAFAVEPHGDGRVTLTLQGTHIYRDDQLAIARELSRNGIEVDVTTLRPGYACKPWGTVATIDLVTAKGEKLVTIDKHDGDSEPAHAWKVPVRVTLSRGNVLVFENSKGRAEPRAIHAYEIDRDTVGSPTAKPGPEPCVPVKLTP